MAKLRVALLFGGVSDEHEISCISGAAVADNMDSSKYEIYKIGISKKGRWMLYPGPTEGMRNGSWKDFPDNVPAVISPDRTTRGLLLNHTSKLDTVKIDVVFPVLHGYGGEDGTIQGLLELSGLPYVGCGVLSSALCMDKASANRVFDDYKIAHTPWFVAKRQELLNPEKIEQKVETELGYPICIKPAGGGSSFGVSKVDCKDQLNAAIMLAMAHGSTVVFEKYVYGQEVECAVLGNHNPVVSLAGEVKSCHEMYDYEAKYNSQGASKLVIPAEIDARQMAQVREMAVKAYKALGCSGLARVDFFVEHETGRILINEVNTMPGFTAISMYPKLMDLSGNTFPQLVDRLIELALERAER